MENLYQEKTILGKKDNWLDLQDIKLDLLPKGFICNGSMSCDNSQLKQLPDELIVKGDLYLGKCKFTTLPKKLVIKNDLILINSNITYLPSDICICGDIIAKKAENIPQYNKNQVYDNFVCDRNGVVIPYRDTQKSTVIIYDNEVVQRPQYIFFKGTFKGRHAIKLEKDPTIFFCSGLKDGIKKIEIFNIEKNGIKDKYKNYDIDLPRFSKEIIQIYKDITGACEKGIISFLKDTNVVLENKYSLRQVDKVVNEDLKQSGHYFPYHFLFEEVFFNKEAN